VIHVSMKSSNVEPALEHLNRLRNHEDDGGIGIMIQKIEEGLNAIHEPGNGE